jgi:hypothetical protein
MMLGLVALLLIIPGALLWPEPSGVMLLVTGVVAMCGSIVRYTTHLRLQKSQKPRIPEDPYHPGF